MEFDRHLLVNTSPIFQLTSLPLTLNVREELTPLYVRYTYFSPHSTVVQSNVTPPSSLILNS